MKLLIYLGRDFLPYTGLVMPPLLHFAAQSSSNDKPAAFDMLGCYADELKEDFYPRIDHVFLLISFFFCFQYDLVSLV